MPASQGNDAAAESPPATNEASSFRGSRWLWFLAAGVLLFSALSTFKPWGMLENVAHSAAVIASVPVAHSALADTTTTPVTPAGTTTTEGQAATSPASTPAAKAEVSTPQSAVPDFLKDTAIVTLAMGDEAARLSIAWARSLRDVETQIPNVIVLLSRGGVGSEDCHDGEWKKRKGRENVRCDGMDTIAEEIISEKYIAALHSMGVKTQVIDPLPDTPYLVIPGGRSTFWGAAVSKLRVFDPDFLPYRKLLWTDADTLYLKNIDHLLHEPMFTAAFTYACCNQNGPPAPSGGLWVVEPSREIADKMYSLTQNPVPGTEKDVWHWGDMQIVRYLFGQPPPVGAVQPLWPSIEDGRHGYVEGLEFLPEYEKMSEKEMQDYLQRIPAEKRAGKGFLKDKWDGKDPKYVWKALNVLYDQCIGNCECLPGRDIPTKSYSVHFSCIQHLRKPSQYATDKDFKEAMYNYATSCSRFWFMKWLDHYERGMGGNKLPAPLYEGPEIPIYDAKHDEVVRANRLKDGKL